MKINFNKLFAFKRTTNKIKILGRYFWNHIVHMLYFVN